jgi:hypothetical protein
MAGDIFDLLQALTVPARVLETVACTGPRSTACTLTSTGLGCDQYQPSAAPIAINIPMVTIRFIWWCISGPIFSGYLDE